MPNINVKAILREAGLFTVAAGYVVASRHLADPEQAECQCQVHREAAKLEASTATPPANSEEGRGTSSPSPKPKKTPPRAKRE